MTLSMQTLKDLAALEDILAQRVHELEAGSDRPEPAEVEALQRLAGEVRALLAQ